MGSVPRKQFDETLGPVRQHGRLINLRPYRTGDEFVVGIENALIVVSRVALAPGDAIAFGPRRPLLVNLWIGNGLGRTLAIFEGDYTPHPLPYGHVEYNGKRVSEEVMHTTILSMLGCSKILVGFQVGWTLAALNLVLPSHRVVDLGTEPAFQSCNRRLLPRRPGWRNAFIENMITSYDRRIPAVLSEIDLCSTPGETDPIRELYYTAAIWNVIQKQTKASRSLPEVYKIKALTPIGCGFAIQPQDDIMFKQFIVLTTVQERRPAAELNATPEDILYLLHESPRDGIEWSGEHKEFIRKCLSMVSE